MSVVSTMATANSAPAFGQTLALTGSTIPSSTSEPTRPLTHRDTIDLAAAASLDALAARPRFAQLAHSMRSLAGRIRLGVAVGKWDEETLSRADAPETIAHGQAIGEERSPQNGERDTNAGPPCRSPSDNDGDMDVDDRSRASSSRRVVSSGSDSEDEPLSSQHRTKALKTRARTSEEEADSDLDPAPHHKRPRVTLIVKTPTRRSPSPSSSEVRIPTPPPRRTASSPSPSEDGSDYDAARDPVHEFVCDVPGCGRTYKYQGAFWKHMARHEQETTRRGVGAARRRGGGGWRGAGARSGKWHALGVVYIACIR